MRRPFLVATILAGIAAVVFFGLRREPAYFTGLAVRDFAEGRFTRDYLASNIDEVHLSPAVTHFFERGAKAIGAEEELAAVELKACGALTQEVDPNIVRLSYEKLLAKYPESALIRYRYGAYLLTRLQTMALESLGAHEDQEEMVARDFEAANLARDAREQLLAAANADTNNSLPLYEIAYSYYIFGETEEAFLWLGRGFERPEFDAGDDIVLASCASLVTQTGAPRLEGLIATYKVGRYMPSYMSGRMEVLVSGLLSKRVRAEQGFADVEYVDYLLRFEDLSTKLFQSAQVLRQSQSSLVTGGILWRRVAAEAAVSGDADLLSAAREELAKASYRYLLVGWQRAGAGLAAQQGIVELDTPAELRLPSSGWVQAVARTVLMAFGVLAIPAVVSGVVAVRVKGARQLAAALTVLAIFAAFAYAASFYALVSERENVSDQLERRLEVITKAPELLRAEGDPSTPSEIRTDIAKKMLFVPDYSMQAGRVLAYVGTRDCYDALFEALSRPSLVRSAEVIAVLREETGEDFGYDATGPKAANYEAIQKWRRWWQSQRNSVPEAAEEQRGA